MNISPGSFNPIPSGFGSVPPGQTYTVQRGDTLWDIARAHGVSLDALLQANPQIANPDLIYPDQSIRLPSSVGGPDGANGAQPGGAVATPGAGGDRLVQGSSGPEVLELQQMLKALGYYHAHTGGNFGPQTDAAVRAFQRDHGLVADGWAGPQTLDALRQASAGVSAPGGTTAPTTPAAADARLEAALQYGAGLIGNPYRAVSGYRMGEPWPAGHTGTDFHNGNRVSYPAGSTGYDCSGLVVAVFRHAGINMSATGSKAMLNSLPPVDRGDLRRGDLIVKDGHVAIYWGPDNQLLESTRSGGVHISNSLDNYLGQGYQIRRVPMN